jgi:phosphoribosylanthranilate isomerase
MRDAPNIVEVAALQPDYMGFIFYKPSPRYVGEEFNLPSNFPDAIERVGVFVNETTAVIKDLAEKFNLTTIQLHGSESPEQCKSLREGGLHIIKAFAVDDTFDFEQTIEYKPYVDFFLFDTKGKFHGGNAKRFNWEILKKYDQEFPFLLSGGLSPDNIEEINVLEGMNIHAIDINSGVEVKPGWKNVTAIKEVNELLKSTTLNKL